MKPVLHSGDRGDGASFFELGGVHVAHSEMPDQSFAAEVDEHRETFADRYPARAIYSAYAQVDQVKLVLAKAS